jgi:hypothetical protein
MRAYREGGYRQRETSAALGIHYSTINRRLATQERTPARSATLLRRKT